MPKSIKSAKSSKSRPVKCKIKPPCNRNETYYFPGSVYNKKKGLYCCRKKTAAQLKNESLGKITKKRMAPKQPASAYAVGKKMKGADGAWRKVVKSANGSKRWQKIKPKATKA